MKISVLSSMLLFSSALAWAPPYQSSRGCRDGHHGQHGDGDDGHKHRKNCLSQRDVDSILSRWPRLFDGGAAGIDLANTTTTSDIILFDETFNFGNYSAPEASSTNRDMLVANLRAGQAGPQSIKDGMFSGVAEFHNCHQIAWRWQFTGTTSGNRCGTGTLAPAGRTVKYKGIDLLYIRPGTNLIEKVYTSGDFLNLFIQLQVDFRNPSPDSLCPGTTPAPPQCPAPATPTQR